MKLRSKIQATALVAFVIASFASFATPSLAQDASPSPATKKITFVVGTTDDITTANPFAASTTSTDYEMLFLTYDMLQNYDPATLTAAPGVAESYTANADGTEYTFKIRDNQTWSDGKPVTAHDVAFTYNFIMQNEGTGAFTTYLGSKDAYDPKTTFTAPDDTTFIWKLKSPSMAPTAIPYIPILPEHVWSKFQGVDAGALKGYDAMPQVSDGPFKLVEWKRGELIRFEARDDYWGGTPHVDEVVFRIFENQEAEVTALKAGEIDAMNGLTSDLFESLDGVPGITTLAGKTPTGYNLALNLAVTDHNDPNWPGNTYSWYTSTSTGSPALQDVRVRRAIAYALDKQSIIDNVLGGHGTVGDSFISPLYSWYSPPSPEYDYLTTQNMEKAKQLMDEAGFRDSDGDGVREEKDGTPLTFDLLVLANNDYSNQSGKFVKEWLQELGWKVNLMPMSGGSINQRWYKSDYDGYIWYWGDEPDPNFMLSIFTQAECLNWSDTCFTDPEYERLYKQQLAETDVEKRHEIVAKMQDIFYDQAPEQWLFFVDDLQAVRSDKWEGFVHIPEPNGGYIYSWGPATYINVQPKAGGGTTSGESGGTNAFVFIGIGALVLVVLAFVFRGRARKAEDEG